MMTSIDMVTWFIRIEKIERELMDFVYSNNSKEEYMHEKIMKRDRAVGLINKWANIFFLEDDV